MSANHPNRRARESVLELLFAHQFSDHSPDVVFDDYLKKNPNCLENSDFAKTLLMVIAVVATIVITIIVLIVMWFKSPDDTVDTNTRFGSEITMHKNEVNQSRYLICI